MFESLATGVLKALSTTKSAMERRCAAEEDSTSGLAGADDRLGLRLSWLLLGLVVAVTIIVVVSLFSKAGWINGPPWWKWGYRGRDWRIPLVAMLGATLPLLYLVLGQLRARGLTDSGALPHRLPPRIDTALRLAGLGAALFAFQIIAIALDTYGLERLTKIITSAWCTSYYTDALTIDALRDYLGSYATQERSLHSITHPPGAIIYYWVFTRIFTGDFAALFGGLTLAAIVSLGPAVVYWTSSLWTTVRQERLLAAAFFALLPVHAALFPQFDQVYPIFALLMVYGFSKSLRGPIGWCVFFGGALSLSLLFAYNLFVMGAFMVLDAVVFVFSGGSERSARARRVVGRALVSLFCWVAITAAVSVALNHNPIASFEQSFRWQAAASHNMGRPWLPSLFYDPLDFFFGSGLITLPILAFFFVRRSMRVPVTRETHWMTWCGLGTIAIVALTGLLRTETARVWLFLQPLVLIPTAIALHRQRIAFTSLALVCLWLVACVMKASLWFVGV